MLPWDRLWPLLIVLVAGCGGDSGEGDACEGDFVVTCPCEDGREGHLACKNGTFGECVCVEYEEGTCQTDADCDDYQFCNGRERCRPDDEDADRNGCLPAASTPDCDDGIDCTEDSCSNSENRCVYEPPDQDNDGHTDASCLDENDNPLGDDCDDDDGGRYPGNFEVCDEDDVDEDCDEETFGLRDQDGDGAIDDQCCNGDNCGDDCNDQSIAQRPLQPEFCDDVDNDCDGEVDNDTRAVPWYVDLDGDGFGSRADADVIDSCIPIPDRSLVATDCNDEESARHPAQLEICDLADNNCNGLADEGSECGVPLGFPVVPGSGALLPPGTVGAGGSSGSGTGGAGGSSGTGGSGGTGGTGGSGGTGGTGGSGGTGGTDGTGGSVGTTLEIACDSREVMDATVVSALGAGSHVWSGVIHLTSSVSVDSGESLIIEPGTQIVVDPEVRFRVHAGDFASQGTEKAPVRFCGKEPTPGYWEGVLVDYDNALNYFEYTLIADGGGGGFAALRSQANVPLRHVRVENSGGVGVRATSWGFGSSDLTVTTSSGYALELVNEVALRDLPLGGTFTGNAEDIAALSFTSIRGKTDIPNVGLSYLPQGNFYIYGTAAESTIEAGVEFTMRPETIFDIGYAGSNGLVKIDGTPLSPVILHGQLSGAGLWGGVSFGGNLTAGSYVNNLVVQDAGFNRPAVIWNAPGVPLDGLILENNLGPALDVGGGMHPTSGGISIADTDGLALELDAQALLTIPADTTITNETAGYIKIDASSIVGGTGTIPALPLPYRREDPVYIYGNAAVTVAPGVHFQFGDDAWFEIGYAADDVSFFATGTPEAPIVFDHILGDSSVGWRGIIVRANVDSNSTFQHVQIKNAGSDGKGALWHLADPAIAAGNIAYSTFENSAAHGIYMQGDTTVDHSGHGNQFINNALSDIGP